VWWKSCEERPLLSSESRVEPFGRRLRHSEGVKMLGTRGRGVVSAGDAAFEPLCGGGRWGRRGMG